MKNLLKGFVVTLVAVFVVSIYSCDETENIIPAVPSMKATVNDTAWTSIFRLTVVKQTAGSELITVTGTPTLSETADKAIIVTVNGIEAREYNLSTAIPIKTECAIVYKKTASAADGDDDYYVSVNAKVNITSIDLEKKTLSGTFSGTLYPNGNITKPSMEITNGSFENLNFQ